MALFQEIDLSTFAGGQIVAVTPGSVAADIELRPGDELLAINDTAVQDVIDVQFYGAEPWLELLIRRGDELLLFEAARDYDQELGFVFNHPTFDTDIRRCNNLCEFCFVLQMAPRFRRTLYVKDDDYRYSFLQGHFVTLTNLDERDWQRIETMRLSPLYISVHVTDLERRRAFLRNPNAPDILAQLKWLAERDIDMHTQLVIAPGVNDGRWLAQSIDDLAALWPAVRSISVVPVGLTRHHKYGMRSHTPDEAGAILDDVISRQPEYQRRFGARFVYPTDEWYLVSGRPVPPADAYDDQALHENGLGMVRHFLDEWTAVQGEIARAASAKIAFASATLVTGTLFAPLLTATAAAFSAQTGVDARVLPVENRRLGGTITAAGLLMGADIGDALAAAGAPGEVIILPRLAFDHPEIIALDDITPADIARRLGRPVALADTMGDVWDAVTGQSEVLFEPDAAPDSINLKVLGADSGESAAHMR